MLCGFFYLHQIAGKGARYPPIGTATRHMSLWLSLVFLGVSVCALLLCAIFVKQKALKTILVLLCAITTFFFAGYAAVLFLQSDAERAPDDETAASATDPAILAEAHERADSRITLALEEIARLPMDPAAEQDVNPDPYLSYPFEAVSAYDTLTDAQKALYDEILPKIAAIEDFTYRADEYGYDTLDDLLMATMAIDADYPRYEMYYTVVDVMSEDGIMTEALRSFYFMPANSAVEMTSAADKEALRHELAVFDAVCQLVVDAIPENATTYDQYRFLAAYISLVTQYDYNTVGGNQVANAYGSILGGYSICQGYSVGYAYLCRLADLWCGVVSGESREVSHAWNLVKLASGTYHADITWSDDGGYSPSEPGWYDYFLLTQEEILFDHDITDGTVASSIAYPKPFPVYG